MSVTPNEIYQALTLLGVGGILLELTKRVIGWLTGRGPARRNEVERAWDSRDEARGERDEQARRRRIAEEYASRQTRRLIEAPCVDDKSIEPFPTYKETS